MDIQYLPMPEKGRARKENLMLRLSGDEKYMIEVLAHEMGLSMADALRQLVRAESARRGLKRATKKRARRSKEAGR
jgi:hypothetical protein